MEAEVEGKGSGKHVFMPRVAQYVHIGGIYVVIIV